MKRTIFVIMIALLVVATAALGFACDAVNGTGTGTCGGGGNGGEHYEHEFGDWNIVVRPTCTDFGRQERYCECGEKEEETLDPLGHDYEEQVTDPTCTTGGYTTYTCSRCSDSYTGNEVPALGHKYVDGVCERCHQPIAETEGLQFALKKDGTYEVSGYNGTEGDVVILATHEGKAVTSIGEEVFYCNDKVSSVLLPSGITEIKTRAFSNSAIEEIVIPASLQKIGRNAFSYSRLASVTFAENGSLTEIGAFAFDGCYSLTEIEIPEGVQTLGEQAFASCESLTALAFPASLTSIGKKQTSYCTKLNSLTVAADNPVYAASGNCLVEKATKTLVMGCNASVIPADGSVEVLAEDAFYGCYSLTEFAIPASVTTIEYNALPDGSNLVYNVYEGGKYFGNEDNRYMVFVGVVDKDAESIVLANTVKILAPKAFYGANISAVVIPASVETISAYAFQYNGTLTSIVIPANVKTIGKYAFSGCRAIKTLSFEENSAIENIGDGAFWECMALETVTLPAGLSEVGREAFRSCPIKTATVPASVLAAMTDKSALETITIQGGGVIEKNAFAYASALTTVRIGSGITEIGEYAFDCCRELISVEVGANVKKIDHAAFYGCSALETLTFAAGSEIEVFGDGIFTGCSSLTYREDESAKYLVGADNEYLVLVRPLDSMATSFTVNAKTKVIYNEAFGNMNRLASVSLPAGLRAIERNAFLRCTALTAVDIPSNVTYIGAEAFYGSGLESVTIPAGVKNILFGTFQGTPIESVFFAEGSELETIERNAFRECSSLRSINIPSTIKSIGSYAFEDCSSLEYREINNGYYLGNLENAFLVLVKIKDKSATEFAVHADTSIIYQSAFQYCDSLVSVSVPAGVVEIGDLAFAMCTELRSVSLPDGLTAINMSVFNGCRSLTSITIPAKVKVIDWYAFSGCANLETVAFAAGSELESIGKEAFRNCEKLANFRMPSTVESIGEDAFDNCASLTSLVIPASLKELAPGLYGAFAYCSGLESITVEEGNEKYYAEGNCLIEKALGYSFGNDEVILGCKNSVIPENAGIGYISKGAFFGRTGLTSVVIPDGVRGIGPYAFRDCKDLLYIELPETLSEIRTYAFEGCYKLIEIFNKSSSLTLTVGNDSYGGIAYYAKNVYTQEGEGKLAAANDEGYVLYVDGDEVVLAAYFGEEKELVLPAGLTEINRYALYGGDYTSVTIPATVKKIGDHALYDNRALTAIVFEENSSLTEIGYWAFCSCVELTAIEIPAGVTAIEPNTLSECDKLTTLTLSNGTSIQEYAMTGLDALSEIRFNGSVDEWLATEKGEGWDDYSGNYSVVCSDGTVNKNGVRIA